MSKFQDMRNSQGYQNNKRDSSASKKDAEEQKRIDEEWRKAQTKERKKQEEEKRKKENQKKQLEEQKLIKAEFEQKKLEQKWRVSKKEEIKLKAEEQARQAARNFYENNHTEVINDDYEIYNNGDKVEKQLPNFIDEAVSSAVQDLIFQHRQQILSDIEKSRSDNEKQIKTLFKQLIKNRGGYGHPLDDHHKYLINNYDPVQENLGPMGQDNEWRVNLPPPFDPNQNHQEKQNEDGFVTDFNKINIENNSYKPLNTVKNIRTQERDPRHYIGVPGTYEDKTQKQQKNFISKNKNTKPIIGKNFQSKYNYGESTQNSFNFN